ncbi:MAG: GtrA family protein [Thiobacillus sp.]|nr:GtrA family protein [Thiobacillus sp.]
MIVFVKQFSLFSLVGAVGTIAHYALLFFLVSQLTVHPVAASVAGALLGALINYILNYRFTFRSARRHREALPRFLAIAAVGLALNTALMWLLVEPLRLHYLISQLIATACVLLWNYLGNRHWTFEKGISCKPRT